MSTPSDDTPHGLTPDPPTDDTDVGRLLAGRYELRERIAEGGMGAIFKSLQRGLGRYVAVKVLHEHLSTDDEVARRFYREMQATARIEHPNTVRVYDFGHDENGRLFLVMELLHGRSLDQVLVDEGPLSVARTARIGAQIANALVAAHREGVIHRDLKAENVLLCDDAGQRDLVKILDFGLARLVDGHPGEKTQVGVRVGTPVYMAPEVIEHQAADERADLYALGVLQYEMIVGKPPFVGSPHTILEAHRTEEAPRAGEATAKCPAWLDRLIGSLLRKDPTARPHDAAKIAYVLEQGALREAAIEMGHLDPPPPPASSAPGQLTAVALMGGAGGMVLGGAIVAGLAAAAWAFYMR